MTLRSHTGSIITCAWCNEDAVCEVQVEPPAYDKKTFEVTKFAINAPACVIHREKRKEPEKPLGYPLRRKARGVKQMTIFDVPGVGSDNAIYGDER